MMAMIQIIFISSVSGSKILQRSEFQMGGRTPAQLAYQWWEQIKREMHVAELHQCLCNGEDITDQVKAIDRQQKTRSLNNFPF